MPGPPDFLPPARGVSPTQTIWTQTAEKERQTCADSHLQNLNCSGNISHTSHTSSQTFRLGCGLQEVSQRNHCTIPWRMAFQRSAGWHFLWGGFCEGLAPGGREPARGVGQVDGAGQSPPLGARTGSPRCRGPVHATAARLLACCRLCWPARSRSARRPPGIWGHRQVILPSAPPLPPLRSSTPHSISAGLLDPRGAQATPVGFMALLRILTWINIQNLIHKEAGGHPLNRNSTD